MVIQDLVLETVRRVDLLSDAIEFANRLLSILIDSYRFIQI
jgi:hypothetical protein